VAPGVAGMAVVLTTQALGSSYGGLPFYGTAATAAGARSFRNFGYEPVHPGRPDVGNLFVLRRTPPSETSAEDKADASSPATKNAAEIRIVVAHSSLEIEHARAIRAAVFIAEQDCPFAEEFDGNDFSATHLVGYVNGEPAATLRIRYFGDGARIERLAVLRRFRKQAVANEIATAAIGFLSRKGIRMAYGNPQLRVLAFWERYGFRRIDGIEPFAFSDHEYVTVGGPLPEHPDPITVNSDPLLILRPEGDWDGPGVLDFSAARPATNPHAEGS
jgi:predicted GNAT family N-acyltransferase